MSQALLRRDGALAGGGRYTIRPARPDDAAALVALRDAVAAEGDVIAAAPGERSVAEEALSIASLVSQGGLAIVADVEGAVAGHLMVHRRLERYTAHIGDLAILVDNAHRGRGLGRLLMDTAVDWARAVGLGKLCLSVFPENARAIALYRSVGFTEEGVRRAHIRLPQGERDLLIMALHLYPQPA